jgi:hypothetical protein
LKKREGKGNHLWASIVKEQHHPSVLWILILYYDVLVTMPSQLLAARRASAESMCVLASDVISSVPSPHVMCS